MNKQYPLDQCALYKVSSKKKLEDILLLERGELRALPDYIDYRPFSQPKASGGFRQILEPVDKLKKLQRRLCDLLSGISKPNWVVSGSKGKCYLDNALIHENNSFVLTMDINSFYDACQREYVYRFFRERLICSPDVAKLLTDICTYEGRMPTGSPTSQIVAYFAYEKMFHEIASTAEEFGCSFSLYVDDMTFSSPCSFAYGQLANQVNVILRRYGHKAKRTKTRFYTKDKHKVITGVAITPDGETVAPNRLRHRILDNMKEFKETRNPSLIPKIRGQIQAARFVEGNDLFQQVNFEINNEA